jgi:hypothetical protein
MSVGTSIGSLVQGSPLVELDYLSVRRELGRLWLLDG